jgi:hypothetical protein
MVPGRGQDHLCWWPLIFKKNFLIFVLSDLPVLMTTCTIHHWQLSFLLQPAMVVVVVLPKYTNKL